MKISKLWALAGTAAAMSLLAGCGKESGSLATVAGEPITLQEFSEYLESKPTVRVIVNNGQVAEVPVAETLAFQAMQDLVTRKVLLQLATDEGVRPSAAQVDEEVKFKTELNPAFIKQLQARGMSMDAIRNQVELDLSQERLLTKGVSVTDEEVEKFIKENPKQFVEPATATMSWILVNDEAGRTNAQQELDRGKAFKEVAKANSVAPGAMQNEGAFQITNISQMSPELQAAISKVEPGKTTDWIKTGNGFAKFLVNAKTAEKPLEMTAARKTYLKRQLAIQRGRQGTDLTNRVADKLRESKIEVQERTLKDLWAKFEERLKATAKDTKLPTTSGQ